MRVPNRAFCDVDGLLTRFAQAALAAHGILDVELTQITRWDFPMDFGFADTWGKDFWEPFDADFWAGLPWHEEGKALLAGLEEAFGSDSTFLVSTAVDFPDGCETGKRRWIRDNAPTYLHRHAFTPSKHMMAYPGSVLLDDKNENVDAFVAARGGAVLVPRPWNRRRRECDRHGCFDVEKIVLEAVRASRTLPS